MLQKERHRSDLVRRALTRLMEVRLKILSHDRLMDVNVADETTGCEMGYGKVIKEAMKRPDQGPRSPSIRLVSTGNGDCEVEPLKRDDSAKLYENRPDLGSEEETKGTILGALQDVGRHPVAVGNEGSRRTTQE